MSGTAAVTNQFATAVTATGAQLDANFSTVVAYINDPTNRNNYAADGGAGTNTFALTFAPPVVGGYTAGLQITFRAALGNTGAAVINANGLGNVSLFSPAGAALAGGEITANQMVIAAYNGTAFQMLSTGTGSIASAATAAQVSAGVSLTTYIPPGRSANQPGAAKAWVRFNGATTGTQTITANGYNVSTVARAGTGSYTINFATPFADANYAILATSVGAGAGLAQQNAAVAPTTAAVTILTADSSTGVPIDRTIVSVICFGNQ